MLEKLRPLLLFVALALYYFLVVDRLQSWIASTGVTGFSTQSNLKSELQNAKNSEASLDRKLQAESENLKDQFGTLRLTGERYEAPIDALVNALEESCRELGIVLRTLTPAPRTRTGVFEVEGVQCQLELPTEGHLAQLLNLLREKGRSRNAMVHGLAMARADKGLALSMSLSILRKRVDPTAKDRSAGLEAFLGIQRDRAVYAHAALMEPRPATAVGQPSPTRTPNTKPAASMPALTSTAPVPAVAPLGGPQGLGAPRTKDAAILEVGGAAKIGR